MQVLAAKEDVQAMAALVLLYPAIHKRSIYVSPDDPYIVTGMVSWRSACIGPAFMHVVFTPDFADKEVQASKCDDNRAETKDDRDLATDAFRCYQTYDRIMTRTPKLRPATDYNPSYFELLVCGFLSWGFGAPHIRQLLLDVKNSWTEMELPGDCPYRRSEEELRDHARQYKDYEAVTELKEFLMTELQTDSDGWVPNERWEAALEAHRDIYAKGMKEARESEARGGDLTVEKADRLWPFDPR
jgi:hypothetical protein